MFAKSTSQFQGRISQLINGLCCPVDLNKKAVLVVNKRTEIKLGKIHTIMTILWSRNLFRV